MEHISPENLLFLDIETIPQTSNYEEMDEARQKLWAKKAQFFLKEGENPEDIFQRSGIYAEFGKIICISVGHLHSTDGELGARIKSFYGEDEVEILQEFKQMLLKYAKLREFSLCAHNGKEFDFPYIARRMLINSIPLPPELDMAGKKPWEIKHIDTMELWKFGDYKNYTSLELLCNTFSIPTPKDDIDGSQVAKVFYEEKNLKRIVKYCEKDVIAIIQLMQRFNCRELILEENIEIVV